MISLEGIPHVGTRYLKWKILHAKEGETFLKIDFCPYEEGAQGNRKVHFRFSIPARLPTQSSDLGHVPQHLHLCFIRLAVKHSIWISVSSCASVQEQAIEDETHASRAEDHDFLGVVFLKQELYAFAWQVGGKESNIK
jgi:hypothetical protein